MLYMCPAFQRMSPASRRYVIRDHLLCRNCFKQGHQARDCLSKTSCRKCRGRHHTMVCYQAEESGRNRGGSKERRNSAGSSQQSSSSSSSSEPKVSNITATSITSSNMAHGRTSTVLLATAVILIEDDIGVRYPARALLDSGSECNFVSEKLCQRMNISREGVNVSVLGIGSSATKSKHRIRATVKSRVSTFSRVLSFLVLPKVSTYLPTATVNTTGWDIPDGVELADPAFFHSKGVDLVLGIQSFFSFFRTGNEIPLGDGLPLLTETVFGWVISGEVSTAGQPSRTICNMAVSDNLEELLTRFWSCEEVGATNNYSPEEVRCEEHFGRTVRREDDGRYTVQLPKDEGIMPRLGESKEIALRRLQGLERRLSRDEELRKRYEDFMTEYLKLGHMRVVEEDDSEQNKRCYLPHHPVVKEASTTTKVRVVFDASCKTSTGVSLNDTLLVGPTIQQDLRTIILSSRMHQIMVVADVEKMFRQIKMDPADAPLQSILWRFCSDTRAMTYELSTVTYGTKPAPFLATRTLKQLAMDEGERFPLAARTVNEDIYMDDVISGANDEETATELRIQLDKMMSSGGFKLRKWASNCSAVLQGVPNENLALPEEDGINWDQDPAVKTLGLTWLPATDNFKFEFVIPRLMPNRSLTKRRVLSIIATLFDPLGLLGATITVAKIFMQLLWTLRDEQRLDWDAVLPPPVAEQWLKYHQQLPILNDLRIQRCVVAPGAASIEIHCFSDASERAYGTCIYVRSMELSGRIRAHLLTSKSKVSPLKVQSLPRLELCGALLAAQLLERVVESVKIPHSVYFWTDSTCVLRWIRAPPTSWTTFVANRVAKIQGVTENCKWQHVPGVQNPADLISRGIPPDTIKENSLWWEGPGWLKEDVTKWPKQPELPIEDPPEKRRNVVACTATKKQEFSTWYLSKYGSYTKAIRSTVHWMRLMAILRDKEGVRRPEFITSDEIRKAELVVVRVVQLETFAQEFKALSTGGSVSRSSPLRWFNPAVDDSGVLRVGGRLGHSQETEEVKHPMVLPARHEFTKLIVRYYHEKLLHAGPQLLLATLRLRFWPLGGRNMARKILHQCQRCFRAKPFTIQQQMGELPSARVTVSRAFLNTGVDYFGPVYIKAGRKQTSIKSYVAVFVCMSTKAVHLEHVSDLSTERFLQALRRFVARRGRCAHMYSDNGTNFVGAKRKICELFNLLKDRQHQEAVSRECAREGIWWHFNPPSAPHFGGLWEAAVRSTKFHLLRVLGESPVSSEDFTTLLAQVEACLNSRPLTPMSDDPMDLEPLTPAHFLIGGSLHAIPDPDYSEVQMNRLNRWQFIQRQLQDFWRRWRTEYLSQLQSRTKNWKPAIEVEVGRLVVIVDGKHPPMQWKMGRIVALHPGDDDVVRVVTVKTANGNLKRPVAKLCILPIPEAAKNPA